MEFYMKKLFVLLPCYNEEKDLRELLKKWQKTAQSVSDEFGFEVNVVGVNDGSRDSTLKILNDFKKEFNNAVIIDHSTNKGLGKALESGFKHFIKEAGSEDLAVVMDADNTHNPSYIISMLTAIKTENSDVVIASRYCKSSRTQGVPFYRNLMSFGARFVYSIYLKVPGVKDYTCGYRLYTLKSVKLLFDSYKENAITQSGFSCMAEVLYKMHLLGISFAEVPFVLEYGLKQGGSKMPLMKTVKNSLIIVFNLTKQGRKK